MFNIFVPPKPLWKCSFPHLSWTECKKQVAATNRRISKNFCIGKHAAKLWRLYPFVSSHPLAIVLRIDESFLFLWWRAVLQLMALVDCRWCWWCEVTSRKNKLQWNDVYGYMQKILFYLRPECSKNYARTWFEAIRSSSKIQFYRRGMRLFIYWTVNWTSCNVPVP